MTIETGFLALMPSTVTVYAQTARDSYGKQTFASTGTTTRCRIQLTAKTVRDANGNEVLSSGVIYFYGTPAIDTTSRLVLPDGTDGIVISSKVQIDGTGSHHTVVVFGGA
jgi:hypothetical protein